MTETDKDESRPDEMILAGFRDSKTNIMRYNLTDRKAAVVARREAVSYLRGRGHSFKAIAYALGTTRNVVESIWHRCCRETKLQIKTAVHPPLPGEIRMNEFVRNEAKKLRTKTIAVHMRIRRGFYPGITMRRVNKRVVFVVWPPKQVMDLKRVRN